MVFETARISRVGPGASDRVEPVPAVESSGLGVGGRATLRYKDTIRLCTALRCAVPGVVA
jgi:hypothetical protein